MSAGSPLPSKLDAVAYSVVNQVDEYSDIFNHMNGTQISLTSLDFFLGRWSLTRGQYCKPK